MSALGGKAWLAGILGLVLLMGAPFLGWPPGSYAWGGLVSFYPVGTPSSMEAQLLGEKPSPPARSGLSFLPEGAPTLSLDQDGATLKLPYNLEMNISVHYNLEPSREALRLGESPLLMKYSMDYRLLPNLQVGLSSYLYRSADDGLFLQRSRGTRLGLGPELKYDLGHWSFLLKSQMESGSSKDQPEGLQNWFRVWYAF